MDADLLDAMTKLQLGATFKWLPDKLDPGFTKDQGLQDDLELAVTGGFDPMAPGQAARLDKHAFAVADLTDDPTAPTYAGWKDTEHRRIASMAKLLTLYGAFALRHALRGAWPSYAPNFAALASKARLGLASSGARGGTRPLIEDLYQKNPAGEIDFRFGGSPGSRYSDETGSQALSSIYFRNPPLGPARVARVDGQLANDAILKAELQDNISQGRVPAEDQLRLIAGWSDNVSAGVMTQALGFPYLWALASASGLYRPSWPELTKHRTETKDKGGLNLTSDYNNGSWNVRVEAPTNTTQGATARSVAWLMTMLARDKLVDPGSDAIMREMLRKSSLSATFRGESSPIGSGMEARGWTAVQQPLDYDSGSTQPAGSDLAVSKVGLLHSLTDGPEAACNALIIRKNRDLVGGGKKLITAILVGINSDDDDPTPIVDFGKRMAKVLDQRHGLKTMP